MNTSEYKNKYCLNIFKKTCKFAYSVMVAIALVDRFNEHYFGRGPKFVFIPSSGSKKYFQKIFNFQLIQSLGDHLAVKQGH